MDLPTPVISSLKYLSDGNLTQKTFDRILQSAFQLIIDNEPVERVGQICPEKREIVEQAYASLLALIVHVTQIDADEATVREYLSGVVGLKEDCTTLLAAALEKHQAQVATKLSRIQSLPLNIVDAHWRLDYVVKSSTKENIGEPVYLLLLTTELEGIPKTVSFTCDQYQLQELSIKLKEIVRQIESFADDANWNKLVEHSPDPLVLPATITPIVKQKVTELKKVLEEALKVLTNLECLHAEAKALSLFLYKNYRALKKDKGIQHLKMIMNSLKKYAEMDVVRNVKLVLDELPARFSLDLELPTRSVLRWLISRIQALAVLFYRVFHLTKRAGLFLYGRIRLLWNPVVLFLCLGMTARIFCTARFLVLQCVKWHSSIVQFVHILPKTAVDPYKGQPVDLKKWMGGLEDISTLVQKKSSLDLIFDLVDLTGDNNDEQDEFIEIINDFGIPRSTKDEIEHLCDIVTLDSSQDDEMANLDDDDEDIGEPISFDQVEDSNESVEFLGSGSIITIDDEPTEISSTQSLLKKKKKNRKRAFPKSMVTTGNLKTKKRKKKSNINLLVKPCNGKKKNKKKKRRFENI